MTKQKAKELIKEAISAGRKSLLEYEAKALLSAWGIPVPKSVSGQEDIKQEVAKLVPPFVLKVISPDILHKSDVGGVVVGLKNEKEIEQALNGIKMSISNKAPHAKIEGFLLEEMAPNGVEVIIGGINDPQFGPAVMFGIGGVAVELLKDVAFRLAPIKRSEALEMMKEVKSYPLLTGFRGMSPVDIKELANTIAKVSEVISELDGIKEIEINPLIAPEKGVIAVDARVILK